jgi:putative addiction module killer protein
MPTIRALPQFSAWLEGLKDARERGAIVARITRLQLGNAGDAASVGDGVMELRIHLGAGWRVYCTQVGGQVVVLLAGGSKSTQEADIRRARQLAALLD